MNNKTCMLFIFSLVLGLGCSEKQSARIQESIFQHPEMLEGNWESANAFLEIEYHDFDKTFWCELLTLDTENKELIRHESMRILINPRNDTSGNIPMVVVDSDSEIIVYDITPFQSGFQARGGKLSQWINGKGASPKTMMSQWEFDEQSRTWTLSQTTGLSGEHSFSSTDMTKDEFIREYDTVPDQEASFSGSNDTFFNKIQGRWLGPDSRGLNYDLEFKIEPLNMIFTEKGKSIDPEGDTVTQWTHFSLIHSELSQMVGMPQHGKALSLFSVNGRGFGVLGKWEDLGDQLMAQYENPNLRLIRTFENEDTLKCTWQSRQSEAGQWRENGNSHVLKRQY